MISLCNIILMSLGENVHVTFTIKQHFILFHTKMCMCPVCAVIHLLILALYKSFVCLLNFLPYFLPYLFTSLLSTNSRIGPFHFQAGGHKR